MIGRMLGLLLVVPGLTVAAAPGPAEAEPMPGLSQALFANPGYTCLSNVYVSTTGSDNTGTGSLSNPWATMQKADSMAPSPGTCVNIEPGIYNSNGGNITLTHGGNAATPTGYVVYRSTTLGGAHLLQNRPFGGGVIVMNASYLVLDGLEVDGNVAGCSGAPCASDYNISMVGATNHNWWIMNTYSHGSGGGGIGLSGAGDCVWLNHNVTNDNAWTNGAAESGVSIWEPHAVPGLTNCGFGPFHIRITWSVSAGNSEGPTIPAAQHTDGDGFIMDTWTSTSYPYPALAANNLAFANGGPCLNTTGSNNITWANNTCYNNYLDTMNSGYPRGEIFVANSSNNSWINNIAQAVVGPGILANAVTASVFGTATGNVWSNNVFSGPRPVDDSQGQTDAFSCTANKCAATPLFASAATGNFALAAGSPAIGYGVTEPYLPQSSVIAGACPTYTDPCPRAITTGLGH